MATKYAKQTFITVPNRNTLKTVSGHAQLVFMWMCSMQNDAGQCYPSYGLLAETTGWSRNTIIKAVSELCDAGMLIKTIRTSRNEHKSNLYEVMIVDTAGGIDMDKEWAESRDSELEQRSKGYPQGSASPAPHRGRSGAPNGRPSASPAPPIPPEGRGTKPTELNPLNYIRKRVVEKSYKDFHAAALARMRKLETGYSR